MKILYIIPVFLFCSLLSNAQNEEDALRFSRVFTSGSARMTAMGGAFGALGGDLSAISINPGGIGVFRKSEFSFTSNLDFSKITSMRYERDKNAYLIGSLGAVFSFNLGDKKWKNVNFAINYNNLNNFNRNSLLGGHTSSNSMVDVWRLEADGTMRDNLNMMTTDLAYNAYLLNLKEGSNNEYDIPLIDQDKMQQQKLIQERGYQGEYTISGGANYNDKFYFGIALGIQNIHHRYYSNYMEGIPKGTETNSQLDYFNFEQESKTTGTGVNFKAGFIYRPIPQIRIGASVHTPTYYNLDMEAYNHLSAWYFESPDPESDETAYGSGAGTSFSYKLQTPWRATAGVAFVLGQKAIISADYEFVDYSTSKFSPVGSENDYDGQWVQEDLYQLGTNDMIKETYRKTHNFRIGAEYRCNSVFSLRAGYAYWASPYNKDYLNKDNNVQSFSGGFGLNFGSFYADAAYVYQFSDKEEYFYYLEQPNMPEPMKSNVIDSENKNQIFKLTLGFRF